jgi:iron complex outermembrane receptor protein
LAIFLIRFSFQISKPSGELSAGRLAQTGEQQVRGLEFNVYGELMPDVRVLGGVSLLDGTLTKSAVAANVGNTPIGVPNRPILGANGICPG